MDNFEQFKSFVWRDVPLAMHSWFQIGGQADFFAEPRDRDELCALLAYCREAGVPIRVIGFGSNVLISDFGVRGVVIRLSAAAFTSIRIEGNKVIAGGGVKLGKVITSSVHGGLAGLEGLIGIPGTVGGAVRHNTSTNNSSIGEYVEALTVARFDGQIVTLSQNDFTFGYQTSSLDDVVILEVVFKLTPEDQPELSKRMQKIWIVRKTTQPTSQHCAGRLFANPRGQYSGDLIELAGLKGTRIGGAVISERDPNFVIIEPECTADDVLRLIELVQEHVNERTNTELELQLERWGW